MIELLVTISIVVLVLSITLTRQSSFNSAVLLRSEAFDIALAIREIQLGAVSATSDGSGEFRSTLGVYFSTDTDDQNRYILFRDSVGGSNDNNRYDDGEAIGGTGIIDPRFEISAIDLDGTSVNNLSVIFNRPNFDAQFYGSSGLINEPFAQIELRLRGTTGGVCATDWRRIEVTRAGQISVVNCS